MGLKEKMVIIFELIKNDLILGFILMDFNPSIDYAIAYEFTKIFK